MATMMLLLRRRLQYSNLLFTLLLLPCLTAAVQPQPQPQSQSQSQSQSLPRRTQEEEELPMDQWYTKYDAYPEYCSTPSQIKQRSIPPISTTSNMNMNSMSNSKYKFKLLHVSAIIRHGARTPAKAHQCWNNFWSPTATTGVWNCELTTMVAPPTQNTIHKCELNPTSCVNEDNEEDEDEDDEDPAMFLFDKRYNALRDPPQLRNELNGTCQIGQLLLRGYVQEYHNGRMLRKTYVKEIDDDDDEIGENGDIIQEIENDNDEYDRNSNDIDESMVLFDLSTFNYTNTDTDTDTDTDATKNNRARPYEEPHLYYRADDDQRTLMSGQVLLRGLFGDLLSKHSAELGVHSDPTIVVHTADRNRDVLSRNFDVCPRLSELEEEAKNSVEYIRLYGNENEEAQVMKRMMETELGGDFQSSAHDCMMSTICTDRVLPDILNDYGKGNANGDDDYEDTYSSAYGTNRFERLSKYSFLPKNFIFRYNKSAVAKLASGPLWVEILSNLLPFLPQSMTDLISNENNNLSSKLRLPPPKLALFSAHDSTLHMLLASLGNDIFSNGDFWAPFASYFVIELHDVIIEGDGNENIAGSADSLFPTGKAFRLVFNGQVLTSKIEGCSNDDNSNNESNSNGNGDNDDDLELCDVSKLIQVLRPFAVSERSCDKVNNSTKEEVRQMSVATGVGISIVSGLLGSLFTFYYLTRRLPSMSIGNTMKRRKYETFDKENSDRSLPELPTIS